MPYDIPRPSGYRIQPFKLQDDEALVAAMAQQLLKARLAQARAAAGGGGGRRGGGGPREPGKGKGEWNMRYDPETKRFKPVWIPGKSKEDRAANKLGMDFNEAADRLERNPEVSKLLGTLRNPGASNLTRQEALKRLNGLRGDPAFAGLDKEAVGKAVSAMAGPYEAEVKEESRKIQSSGRLGALGTSLENAWDRLSTWAGTFGSSDEEKIQASRASAERQARRREADPYLREQDLRLAEEPEMQRGVMARTGGIGNALANMGETLVSDPGMGLALAGGALASVGTGGLALPLAGAALAATGGAVSGDTMFRERLANDPNLSEAEKVRAYGEGALREQAIGAGLNVIPAVSPAAVRAGRMALAARGLEGEAAQAARAAKAAELRSFGSVATRDVPLTAAEGAAVNAGQMALSNQNYGAVTGQDTDLSEGVAESALAGLAFGLATGAGSAVGAWRAGRAARKAGAQTPPPEGGAPSSAKPAAGEEATPEGAAEVLRKEAEAAGRKQDKGKAQEVPAEAQAPEAEAPQPVRAAEPSRPQAPEAEAVQTAGRQDSEPAPQDLPSFKKSEAVRQKQAENFEPDLGEAFETKFRASREYEGYARHEAMRSSLVRSGAGTDAEQASLNAGIARATEGMRQWRERFILDNWDEAKAADKAVKDARREAAKREQEVRVAQEGLLRREERRQARPSAMPRANQSSVGRVSPSTFDWTPVPLPEGAGRVVFDGSAPPAVEVPAATQNAALEVGGLGAQEQALIQRLADIVGASRGKPAQSEARPAARGGRKGAVSPRVDSPFNTRQLGLIYTFSRKKTDKAKNAVIQKNAFLQGDGILDKIDAARASFRQALGGADYVYVDEATGARRTLKNEQLMQSFDQLAERLQALGYKRGGNDEAGNAGFQPDTALRATGRAGEEISNPENTGVHRPMETDTSAASPAAAGGAPEALRVRRAEDQRERDGGRSRERSAETPDSAGGSRTEGTGREPGGEVAVRERSAEPAAEASTRAGEGERGAEPATDAVAGGPAAGRSPAEEVAGAVQPYLDFATLKPASDEYYRKTGFDYYGKPYPDIEGVDSIRETFEPFYAEGRSPDSGRPDYYVQPDAGTEDYYYAVLNTLDPAFRDAKKPNFRFEASRWKDTPFSPEFFQANFPQAWKSGRLDFDDVRILMDPNSVNEENAAVLNGDKTVC